MLCAPMMRNVLLSGGRRSAAFLAWQGTLNDSEDEPVQRNQRVELKLIELPLMVLVKAKAEAKAEAQAEAQALAHGLPALAPVEKRASKAGARERRVSAEDADEDEAPPPAPAAAPAAKEAPSAVKEVRPLLGRLHVHVRGKTVVVACGEGRQTVYWLATTAVQRYLQLPDTYSTPFSHELTPLRVLAKGLPPPPPSRPQTATTDVALGDYPSRRRSSVGQASVAGLGLSTGDARLSTASAVPRASLGDTASSSRYAPNVSLGAASTAVGSMMGDEAGESWRWLDNGDRLLECGLADQEHVWVDVGDGSMALPQGYRAQLFASRAVPRPSGLQRDEREGAAVTRLERLSYSAKPDPMAVTGEQCYLDRTEQVGGLGEPQQPCGNEP